tara:strand:+ start:5583 stop:6041 length:459 start_codon:yes stop_codon:yes gene_type:complete
MRLNVTGASEKVENLARLLVKDFCTRNLPQEKYHEVLVDLSFVNSDELVDLGECWPKFEYAAEYHRPTHFEINIRNTPDNPFLMIKILCHELVHVRQFCTDGLRFYLNGKYKFKKVKYTEDLEYDDMPWEIEANEEMEQIMFDFLQKLWNIY